MFVGIGGHEQVVLHVRWIPNSAMFISTSTDMTVRLWTIFTPRIQAALTRIVEIGRGVSLYDRVWFEEWNHCDVEPIHQQIRDFVPVCEQFPVFCNESSHIDAVDSAYGFRTVISDEEYVVFLSKACKDCSTAMWRLKHRLPPHKGQSVTANELFAAPPLEMNGESPFEVELIHEYGESKRQRFFYQMAVCDPYVYPCEAKAITMDEKGDGNGFLYRGDIMISVCSYILYQ